MLAVNVQSLAHASLYVGKESQSPPDDPDRVRGNHPPLWHLTASFAFTLDAIEQLGVEVWPQNMRRNPTVPRGQQITEELLASFVLGHTVVVLAEHSTDRRVGPTWVCAANWTTICS